MLVTCIPIPYHIAKKIFRPLVKWRLQPLPIMHNFKAFYIMTYNAWIVGKDEFVTHYICLKPLLHTDVWILFVDNFEDRLDTRFMAYQDYHATITRNVAIVDNMLTATVCWNQTAVDITFAGIKQL